MKGKKNLWDKQARERLLQRRPLLIDYHFFWRLERGSRPALSQ